MERLTQNAVEGAVEANRLMEEAKAQRRYVDVSVQTQVWRRFRIMWVIDLL